MTKQEDPLLVAVGRVLKSELGRANDKIADLQQQIDRMAKRYEELALEIGRLERKGQAPQLRRVVGE